MTKTNVAELIFEETKFDVVDIHNIPWLRVQQIAVALGYSRPDVLQQLYASNADEFTEEMTQLAELDTAGGRQQVRIFSPRGCYMIGMLSRTEKAKEFRKWVLDVLEGRAMPRMIKKSLDRDFLLEMLIKESGKGNPVAVETLISRYGYPESIRAEVAKAVSYRKDAARPRTKAPELAAWFVEDFLPRLAGEVRGERGELYDFATREPFEVIEGKHALFTIKVRTSDLLNAVQPLAVRDGVDVRISVRAFGVWLAQLDLDMREAGWVRALASKVHGNNFYEFALLA